MTEEPGAGGGLVQRVNKLERRMAMLETTIDVGFETVTKALEALARQMHADSQATYRLLAERLMGPA